MAVGEGIVQLRMKRDHTRGNIIEGIDVDFPYSHLIKKVIKKINKNNPKRVKDILLGKIVQNDPKL